MVLCLNLHAQEESFYPELSAAQVQELQSLVTRMKEDPRGPYLRIRWFCRDGTMHPPQGTPCRERGGGVQHAEFNEAARRMAELGFHPAPILQALRYEDFANPADDYLLLKELVIQDYLFQIDHFWILRKARYYRGARQIEDEERRGQEFLEKLFSDPGWLDRNFLLASQLVQVVPHRLQAGAGTSRIRLLISRAAELDSRLQPLRVKIHSFPSPADQAAVRRWLEDPGVSQEVKGVLAELLASLEVRYRQRGFEEVLAPFRSGPRIAGEPCGDTAGIVRDIGRLAGLGRPEDRVQAASRLAARIRRQAASCSNGALNLWLVDLGAALQEVAFRDLTVEPSGVTRRQRLEELGSLFELAFGTGYLAGREVEALNQELASLVAQTPSLLTYKRSLNYLTRSLEWSASTARQTFGPVFQRYLRIEPKTSGFFHAMIRSSNLFHLAERLGFLQKDAHRLMLGPGEPDEAVLSSRMRGLNPGLAVGVLHVVERIPTHWQPDPAGIYVIPEAVAELRPVAGLVTLDAGNLLSHVQLLARSLQIPNASASSDLLPELRRWEGQEVLYGVSPMGKVIFKPVATLSEAERSLLDDSPAALQERLAVDLSRARLDRASPIPLEHLRAADSGVVVGPKAANLGELAHMFPGHVARGLALPFGLYYRHVGRPYQAKSTVWAEIQAAFELGETWRKQGRSEQEINSFMFPRLAYFREAIQKLPFIPEDQEAIEQAVETALGSSLGRGVFVRSDTNVEDLPEFSGAGLNLTVPNQRTLPDVLESVKRLWASPFAERAYLWRSRVLKDLGTILPSVLILESVPCDRSGVLITADLENREPGGLTVAVSEGVGGAVQGESAETLVLKADGSVRLLSLAKAPFRRILNPDAAGGVKLVPSSKDPELLSSGDIDQLRQVAETVRRRIPGAGKDAMWDIEFGFTGSQLWLFQVRPFVTETPGGRGRIPSYLDQDWERQADIPVDLAQAL
jgi:hypothetical protein